jgi:hypothetical protein
MEISAIVELIGAVAPIVGTELCKEGAKEAYQRLRSLLFEHSGAGSGLAEAVTEVERKPGSGARLGVLAEELHCAGVTGLPQIQAAAEALHREVAQMGTVHSLQVITGDYNVQVAGGSTAIVMRMQES